MQSFDYASANVRPGRTLVEASAGTGKTFAISGLVLRMVLDGDTLATEPGGLPDMRRLLVVTFTRKATEELRTRIRAALRTAMRAAEGRADATANPLLAPLADLLERPDAIERLDAALGAIDEAHIETIHGFCKQVLTQAAFESGMPFGLDFLEDNEDASLKARAAADVWTSLVHGEPWLAELALRRKWTLETLTKHAANATRFPETFVIPPAPPLAGAVSAIEEASEAFERAWSPNEIRRLAQPIKWSVKSVVHEKSIDVTIESATDFAESRGLVCLDAVVGLAASALAETAFKNANKEALGAITASPIAQAAEAVFGAVETIRLALTHAFINGLARRFAELKHRRRVLTSDDLLLRLRDALARDGAGEALAEEIRRRYAVALVDEFQDTDPIQYQIFQQAFDGAPLYFVGDPKQSIYKFRGADIHAYLTSKSGASDEYSLGTNYRSARPLIEAVNAVFGAPAAAFLDDRMPFRRVEASPQRQHSRLSGDDKAPLVWWTVASNAGKPVNKNDSRALVQEATVGEIVRLLSTGMTLRREDDERPLEPGDIAVLVKSNRFAAEYQEALRDAGVPAVIARAEDIRESGEMSDLEYVLQAFAQPDDDRAMRAALATELWGWTAAEIAALDVEEHKLHAAREVIDAGHRLWQRGGALDALVGFVATENVAKRLLGHVNGERRMTNLRHAIEVIHEAERGGERTPDDLLAWLRDRGKQRLGGRDKSELRLETDARAVQILTHHSSKGLEFEVVFLPSLWDWSERQWAQDDDPLARMDGDQIVYDIGSEMRDEVWERWETERLAEGIRVAYVAMTRARERLYVPYGAMANAGASPLGYLLECHTVSTAAGLDDHVRRARSAGKEAQMHPQKSLGKLASGRSDQMTIEPIPMGDPGVWDAPSDPDADVLGPARALSSQGSSAIDEPWRPVSFSAWAAGRPDAVPVAGADEEEPEARRAEAPETGMHAFVAGTAAGICLHEILQFSDFEAFGPKADAHTKRQADEAESIKRRLVAHGLGKPEAHRQPIDPAVEVLEFVRRAATTPLPGLGFTLSDTTTKSRMAEWRFVAPVSTVAPAEFADLFRQHAAPEYRGDYADSLATLSSDASDGFLTGIVDMVVCHQDTWAIVDWKSNYLGPNADSYGAESLDKSMREHHYILQAQLYLVGLHRMLKTRLKEYDYDRHVAGAFYVFLRGLADGTPDGIATIKPPFALIDALDKRFSS